MSTCNFCIRPGACCENFYLSMPEPDTKKSDGYATVWRETLIRGLPFYPSRPFNQYTDAAGVERQQWQFSCTNLLPNGRCGDYDNRPEFPCRDYKPLQDHLCVMTAGRLLK